MNSRETMSVEALRCIAISERATEAAIRKGVEIGVQAAIDYIEKQRQAAQKNRHDKILHNTELLLKKYRLLKKHTDDVVYSTNQLKENAIDILDSMDKFVVNDGIYIQTLKQSQQRTLVIVRHIEKMVKLYEKLCKIDTPEAQRRAFAVKKFYIDNKKMSVPQIASCKGVSERQIYYDISDATKSLAALIFGVSGLDTE